MGISSLRCAEVRGAAAPRKGAFRPGARRSDDLRAIFAKAPLNRILLETDSPYLAPPPFRGRRNEPAYTAFTAKVGAQIFGVSQAEFAAATVANFDRLFAKAARKAEAG